MTEITPEQRDAPIFKTFGELFSAGFSLDTTTWVFIVAVHIAAVGLGAWLIFVAPNTWGLIAAGWIVGHFILGSLSTTVYSHRLITHNAVKNVSVPVHLFFCFFGQVLSVQGSVRRWSANHVLHHGVDRHGKKELDPYSATWFPDTLRNFLWSHMLSHMFNHPESDAYLRAHNAQRHPIIMLARSALRLADHVLDISLPHGARIRPGCLAWPLCVADGFNRWDRLGAAQHVDGQQRYPFVGLDKGGEKLCSQ